LSHQVIGLSLFLVCNLVVAKEARIFDLMRPDPFQENSTVGAHYFERAGQRLRNKFDLDLSRFANVLGLASWAVAIEGMIHCVVLSQSSPIRATGPPEGWWQKCFGGSIAPHSE
jgi:hypothetical protein